MILADILVAHRHDMLRLWMPAVRREAPETQGLSDAESTSGWSGGEAQPVRKAIRALPPLRRPLERRR